MAADDPGASHGAASPTPVTVITGFLGSGKSTLLKHVLTERHGRRIAVIQNELAAGEAMAEQISTVSETGDRFDEWVELPNGCLCCSVRDKLTVALESLMERRGQFDYILIETTGVANPGALASTFWLDEELESSLMIDGIVTMVDAANVLRHVSAEDPLADANEAVQQIAYADRIVLNKLDLLAEQPERVHEVEAAVRAINGLAPIVRAEHARVDLDLVLHTGSFDTSRVRDVARSLAAVTGAGGARARGRGLADAEQCVPCADAPAAAGPPPAAHSIRVETCTLREERPLDLELVKRWLCDLLWERPDSTVYRMKGVLHCAGEPAPFVLQAVHELWDLKPCAPAEVAALRLGGGVEAGADGAGGVAPWSQVVVIASSLSADTLRQELSACVAGGPA